MGRKHTSSSTGNDPPIPSELIARLKEAGQRETAELTAAGAEDGRAWAESEATPKQLERLCARREEVEAQIADGDPAMAIYRVISLRRTSEAEACDEFWDGIASDGAHDDPDYFLAFVDAACGVWERVRTHLTDHS